MNKILCEGRNYLPIDNVSDGRPCQKEAIRFYVRKTGPEFRRKTYFAYCEEHPNLSTFGISQDTMIIVTEQINQEIYLIGSIHES